MAIPLYLAMTAAETMASPMPENMAYMACHFASYGLGISNIPTALPTGAMLILNDRIPLWEHDPVLIAKQLADTVAELSCGSVLLDFQRPENSKATAITKAVLEELPCPVGVSEHYAHDLNCPVFLSAPPPDIPLQRHILSWKDREIWLEAALETIEISVTQGGATVTSVPFQSPSEPSHRDKKCCCSYRTEISEDRAVFTLSRTPEDLHQLLCEAEKLGVTRAVGLYQQLGSVNNKRGLER